MKKANISYEKNYLFQNMSHNACSNEQGDYYCRAVHAVLNKEKDGFFCGLGCTCYEGEISKGAFDYPVCRFYELITDEDIEQLSPEQQKKRVDALLTLNITTLYPKVDGVTKRLQQAYEYAAYAHRNQLRKGKKMPYMTHLINAVNFTAQLTSDEDILIATLLHDSIEDTETTFSDIELHFGKKVAELVAEKSENKRRSENPCDTWKIRKMESLEKLRTASIDGKLIAIGDKTANLFSLTMEKKLYGEEIWQHFNQKDKEKQRWYYVECKKALAEFEGTSVMKEFDLFFHKVFDE